MILFCISITVINNTVNCESYFSENHKLSWKIITKIKEHFWTFQFISSREFCFKNIYPVFNSMFCGETKDDGEWYLQFSFRQLLVGDTVFPEACCRKRGKWRDKHFSSLLNFRHHLHLDCICFFCFCYVLFFAFNLLKNLSLKNVACGHKLNYNIGVTVKVLTNYLKMVKVKRRHAHQTV